MATLKEAQAHIKINKLASVSLTKLLFIGEKVKLGVTLSVEIVSALIKQIKNLLELGESCLAPEIAQVLEG